MLILKKILKSIKSDIKKSNTIENLEVIRLKYLGKKGIINAFFKKIKNFSLKQKKEYSYVINNIKLETVEKINQKKIQLNTILFDQKIKKENIDVSLPGRRIRNGSRHPIATTINYIQDFFLKIGFQIVKGPEIEDEYHNFDALNISKTHPSRDSHDTFWFDSNKLLRTQTSSMQIRVMEKEKPPIRFIVPGKVYRNDCDSTHTPMFHQIEGLIVDTKVNFSNLKWIIYNFLYNFFGKYVSIKFRPSYFPFTVPSAEVDISINNRDSLEILGCGMVHPQVLKNVNIDSHMYSACAFGIGVERMAMLRYGIADIRYFFENDLRFLSQFKYK
ncbi:phenylalanine--tRNA ligase subunit alpha [Buchnera aphidicola (Muscaphis stroyani)]|uniref:Phenylalanine--tRNA ligase alpha subunit n=1 Tax=Buchnera aphidicola (Muscaphis stroyani) TaxID=1241869 RepID=A0A4D6Y551_9GAMM|nr:phenylalanine--tRNA ligase subunit alpha [Buchnera aphidicola]QCI24229.1 phenylalanine--tRNA ligase subunit alpha [Buchnera aphidicola (Muscaphis stroyani)]